MYENELYTYFANCVSNRILSAKLTTMAQFDLEI
jgi:hypothetical protein